MDRSNAAAYRYKMSQVDELTQERWFCALFYNVFLPHRITMHDKVSLAQGGILQRYSSSLTILQSTRNNHNGISCKDDNYLTSRDRIVFQKLTVPQLLKTFPEFHEIRRFITVFTTAHHLSLPRDRLIPSTPTRAISFKIILILTSHQRLPSGFFPSGFLKKKKPLYPLSFSPIHDTCPIHLIVCDMIIWPP